MQTRIFTMRRQVIKYKKKSFLNLLLFNCVAEKIKLSCNFLKMPMNPSYINIIFDKNTNYFN